MKFFAILNRLLLVAIPRGKFATELPSRRGLKLRDERRPLRPVSNDRRDGHGNEPASTTSCHVASRAVLKNQSLRSIRRWHYLRLNVLRVVYHMIDSISGVVSKPMTPECVNQIARNEHRAWTTTYTGAFHTTPQEWRGRFRAHHTETDLCAIFEDHTLDWVFCSLPKLLGQPNGWQLKSPSDLHRTRAAFDTIMQTLQFRTLRPEVKLTRLDLVLNLHLDPRHVLALHQHARHPEIRRETKRYYNALPDKKSKKVPFQMNMLNTVLFNGTKTRILLYDKVRETLKMKGEWPEFSRCTRVEIQLKKQKHIAKVLGYPDREYVTLHQLEFERCYRAFRNILLEFDHVGRMPAFKPDIASCLAILQQYPETWQALGGVEPMLWYRAKKNVTDKVFGEMRRKVRKLQLQLHDFRWADVLPKDRLPDVVDVDADGNEQLIRSITSFPGTDNGHAMR